MSGLTQAMVDAAMIVLKQLFMPIEQLVETYGPELLKAIVGTPHPDRVFGAPTNGVWPELYAYYWESIVPLSMGLYGLSLGLVILLETTSHLFSGYHTARLKRRAFVGLLGILSWWWLASFSLTLVAGIARFLLPDLSSISLFQAASFGSIGVIGIVVSLSVDLGLFVLLAVIYLLRQLVLYLYVLLVPILIVFWIPGIGPFRLVSQFMRHLASLFVPFLFMTLPIALLFRLGELLGKSISLSLGGIGRWLTALVIPILAVLVPFVMVWQAGALFFMLDRAGRQVSRGTAQGRIDSARAPAATGASAGSREGQRRRAPTDVSAGGSFATGRVTERPPPRGTRSTDGGPSTPPMDEDAKPATGEPTDPTRTDRWQRDADLLGSSNQDAQTDGAPATEEPSASSAWRDERLTDVSDLSERPDRDDVGGLPERFERTDGPEPTEQADRSERTDRTDRDDQST